MTFFLTDDEIMLSGEKIMKMFSEKQKIPELDRVKSLKMVS